MAFQFSLESLLRLRHSLERKERLALEEIARRISAVRVEIADVQQERRTAQQLQNAALGAGLSAAELHFAETCEASREERHRRLTNLLVELGKVHRKQQASYLEARQAREILENLSERQEAEYRRELDRKEQQRVDDLFLMRSAKDLRELSEPPAIV
jgi:flagellar FliJ protein